MRFLIKGGRYAINEKYTRANQCVFVWWFYNTIKAMSSHRRQAAETRGASSQTTSRDVSLPPVSRGLQIRYDGSSSSLPKRSSVTSTTSSGRRSDGSVENFSKPISSKTSGLPRSMSAGSQARLSYIASTRPTPTFAGKSPPLQAMSLGSSTSSIPRLDIARIPRTFDIEQTQSPRALSPDNDYDENPLRGFVRDKSTNYPSAELPPRLIPELQALVANNIPINPNSSSISSISSPSTQFTTSSSPWSASTNTTTPISWSSASPSVTNKVVTPSSKRSNTIPIPATTRSTLPKLPVVKESQLSLTSSKTGSASHGDRVGRKERKPLRESPEPTPPPRSSSLKGSRSRSNSAATNKSESRSATEPSIPPFPNPAEYTTTTFTGQAPNQLRTDMPVVTQGHSRLQEALYSTSRSHPSTEQQAHETFSEPSHSKQLLEPLPIAQNRHRRFPSLSRRHTKKPSTSEPEIEKQSARSRLAKFSRMAIFGRNKVEAGAGTKPAQAQARKGPAAGTGHEGYGKFVRRGRKQSISGSVGTTDSETSVASVARRPIERRQSRISSVSRDQSDLDDFASARSKPVVMVGGSRRGRSHPFPPLPTDQQLSNASVTTVSSTDSYLASTRLVSPRRERFPPEVEERRPSLATRRSQKFAKEEESFPFPEPIDTQTLVNTPALDSRNTTQSSEVPTPASTMYKVDPSMLEKQRNKSKRLKWNIFRRKGSISETEEPAIERPATRLDMSVNVAPAAPLRSVPWYAVPEPDDEMANTSQIVQYLRDAQESPEREAEIISIGIAEDDVPDYPYPNRESILLPQAPLRQVMSSIPPVTYEPQIIMPPSEPQMPRTAPIFSEPGKKRQPRLAQVGRIPKVVSTRQQTQAGMTTASTSVTKQSTNPKTIRPKPSHEQLPRLDTSRPPVTRIRGLDDSRRIRADRYPNSSQTQVKNTEFLRMVDTRNSDFTSSSESSGVISIMGPPYAGLPDTLFRQSQHVHDDEVWNEYNDFMDDIMSPASQTLSPSKQRKAQKSLRIENATPRPSYPLTKARGLAITTPPTVIVQAPSQLLDTPPMHLSNVPSLAEMASSEEIRLRRSRIAAALHNSYAPSSPFSFREFLDEYGRPVSGKYSERLSMSSAAPNTPTLAVAPASRERSQTRQYENAAYLEEVERVKNPTRHSDRQYASLMVSRWLSFGRVLFSPAHQEIEANPQRHVLVIDGLGNEDWSIYCAVTYQAEEAFVHDLKERRRGKGKAKTPQTADGAPPNHRRSEVSSFNEKFPFPPAFFTAIVVRFPPAMPDSKLKNIVSECRRTLAPGGFLELMVLDLDIVNMGVQTRRAIKDLKIKMSASDRTVSLKPIIDNVQTVLGSNGFSNLNRCVVGVPVVGKPVGSLDSSSESRSSSGSTTQPKRSSGSRPYGSLGGQANFSLNDLVADHSENADAKIGRMVSRTARSWWQHCFEAGVMTETSPAKSVLTNKEVLSECKARAANFKLLIAYTQKPSSTPIEQRRRTLSEPTIPTLATAGNTRAQK